MDHQRGGRADQSEITGISTSVALSMLYHTSSSLSLDSCMLHVSSALMHDACKGCGEGCELDGDVQGQRCEEDIRIRRNVNFWTRASDRLSSASSSRNQNGRGRARSGEVPLEGRGEGMWVAGRLKDIGDY